MWLDVVLIVATTLCGWQAFRARQLLTAVLWLAGVSLFMATALYSLGAPQVAVIELSVGAGLVTILFVFAIAIAGDEAMTAPSVMPALLGWLLMLGAAITLGWMMLPAIQAQPVAAEASFSATLWQERGLDVLVQVGLIFGGTMGILGLLSEPSARTREASAVEQPATSASRRPASHAQRQQMSEKEPA
jgi:uncharacterized MnhB-related membrane protein